MVMSLKGIANRLARSARRLRTARRVFHYRWEWQLQATPTQLWPYAADTNRFDRDAGLPAYSAEGVAGDPRLAQGRRRLALRLYGIPLAWIEEPFEWVQPVRFGVVRRYEPGPLPLLQPLAELRVLAQLHERPEGGTHLTYEVWAKPRGPLGYLLIPLQIGLLSRRRFGAVFQRYDRLAMEGRSFLEAPGRAPRFPPGGQERLQSLRGVLVDQGAAPQLVDRLAETVEHADDLTLYRLRPYALADYWRAPRRDVAELALLATRAGLLNFTWDLLCPVCRVVKASAPALSALPGRVHCETCNLDYSINFERSVELTFRPTPAVRLVDEHMAYCTSGPGATPHIVAQQLLAPGEGRQVRPGLEEGRYRLRVAGLPGGQPLQALPGGPDQAAVRLEDAGWSGGEVSVGLGAWLYLENATAGEKLFILERTAWADLALTAADVTALQRFRDLFSREALRPGERIAVGSLSILFTDLCGSTRMYREIGDATAFGLVLEHLDVLQAAIAAEGGAVVKTIGDAVMAVFPRPVAAVRALLGAERRLAAPPPGTRPLQLKGALHHGPCIAVTLNDRLDYFGTTVNVAARLEKLASADATLVISEAAYRDPEMCLFLEEHGADLDVEPFSASLRGLEDEPMALWRITRAPLYAPREAIPHVVAE